MFKKNLSDVKIYFINSLKLYFYPDEQNPLWFILIKSYILLTFLILIVIILIKQISYKSVSTHKYLESMISNVNMENNIIDIVKKNALYIFPSQNIGHISLKAQSSIRYNTINWIAINGLLTLSNIRNKKYSGNITEISLNTSDGHFFIPNNVELYDDDKKNYMKFKDLYGNIKNLSIYSKKAFSIKDNDEFISGSDFFIDEKNQTFIVKSNFFAKKTFFSKNNKKILYKSINSNFSEINNIKQIIILKNNVKFFDDEDLSTILSNYAIIQKQNNKYNYLYLHGDVEGYYKNDQLIFSNYAIFDYASNISIFYHNVILHQNGSTITGNIYIYDKNLQQGYIYNNQNDILDRNILKIFKIMIKKIAETPTIYNSIKEKNLEQLASSNNKFNFPISNNIEINLNKEEKSILQPADNGRIKIIIDEKNK